MENVLGAPPSLCPLNPHPMEGTRTFQTFLSRDFQPGSPVQKAGAAPPHLLPSAAGRWPLQREPGWGVRGRPPAGACHSCAIPGLAPKDRNVLAAGRGQQAVASTGRSQAQPPPTSANGGSGPCDAGLWEDFLCRTLGAGHPPCTLGAHGACSGLVLSCCLRHGPQWSVTGVWPSRQLVACCRHPS